MPNNKPNRNLILIIAMLFLVIVGYAVINRFTEKEPPAEAPVIIKEKSFDDRLAEFTASYKITLLALRREEYQIAEKSGRETFRLWEEVVNNYKDKRPKEFNNTSQWPKKLDAIGDLLGQGNQLIKTGDFPKGYNNYDIARRKLREIRQENNINYAGDEMINFDDQVIKISKVSKKAEVEEYLLDLKLSFTILKEYQFDQKYVKLIEEMEKTIGELDKYLDGPDYGRALKRLPELFYEIYLQYG